MSTRFLRVDAPSGSGKTRAAIDFACERIPRNIKSVICQPTIRLCKQSVRNARERFPGLRSKIRSIVSQPGADAKIPARIMHYLNARDQTGDLLHITHAGLLRTGYWHRAHDWYLFLDETIDVAYHRRFRLEQHRDLLIGL